jgi:hypothetical protein
MVAYKFYESSLINSLCDSQACELSDLQVASGAIRVKTSDIKLPYGYAASGKLTSRV